MESGLWLKGGPGLGGQGGMMLVLTVWVWVWVWVCVCVCVCVCVSVAGWAHTALQSSEVLPWLSMGSWLDLLPAICHKSGYGSVVPWGREGEPRGSRGGTEGGQQPQDGWPWERTPPRSLCILGAKPPSHVHTGWDWSPPLRRARWFRPQEVGEGHLECGGAPLLRGWVGVPPSWECGEDVPTGGEAALAAGHPGAAGSCREPGRMPFSALLFPPPLGYSGKERMWGLELGGRENWLWFSLLRLPEVLSSCFSPSLPCWPPNGKATFPKKGEDTPKKASQVPKPLPAPLAGFSLKAAGGHLQREFCGKENKLCDSPSQTPRSSPHTKCWGIPNSWASGAVTLGAGLSGSGASQGQRSERPSGCVSLWSSQRCPCWPGSGATCLSTCLSSLTVPYPG